MPDVTRTQEHVCRALAALNGRADAATICEWIGRNRGHTVSVWDLRAETRELVDEDLVRLVGVRDVGESIPANVYALTAAGEDLATELGLDSGSPNEIAQDVRESRSGDAYGIEDGDGGLRGTPD